MSEGNADTQAQGKATFEVSMSLDGVIAGPNDGPELPMGDGGERLHEWMFDLVSYRERHGLADGEATADAEIFDETFAGVGAVIVGRRMYDNAEGWGEDPMLSH